MCDTIYKKTEFGFLFGKNSDRSANEPNLTVFYPRRKRQSDKLKCTYIEIDEVFETYACLLIKPSWIWGAEMGINEYNVVIGNEAVFTKSKNKKKESLIGMDFVRLALERSKNALEAMNSITTLLSKYGQGGNCGFDKPFYYDNSYLICDPNDAYILETSGNKYVIQKINETGSISNCLTIGKEYTSSNLDKKEDFAHTHKEPLFTFFSGSNCRMDQTIKQLNQDTFTSYSDMITLLQSHYPSDQAKLLTKGSLKSVCMHQSFLGDHTTSSLIVERYKQETYLFVTSSSTPCISLYKPIFFGLNTTVSFESENEAFRYWLTKEKENRYILADKERYLKYRLKIQNEQLKINELVNQSKLKQLTKNDKLGLMTKAFDIEKKLHKEANFSTFAYRDVAVSSVWKQKNAHLGKNVFKKSLKERLNYE